VGLDRFTGLPLTAFGVLAAGVAWVAVSAAFRFPSGWERIFQTLVAAVTVVMVFVIQHTQAGHQAATQRKLDEILRALPEADNTLLALEHASDDEPRATRQQHRQIRRPHWPRTTGLPAAPGHPVRPAARAAPATPAGPDGNGDGMGAVWPALRWP
jgi:low affinity Fe/Cu permease